MATKIYTVAILLLIAITTTFSTCKKGGLGCANATYSFRMEENISPDKDSIKTGDTIFLNVNTLSSLKDYKQAILLITVIRKI